jgi:hypothetical protein
VIEKCRLALRVVFNIKGNAGMRVGLSIRSGTSVKVRSTAAHMTAI